MCKCRLFDNRFPYNSITTLHQFILPTPVWSRTNLCLVSIPYWVFCLLRCARRSRGDGRRRVSIPSWISCLLQLDSLSIVFKLLSRNIYTRVLYQLKTSRSLRLVHRDKDDITCLINVLLD